jgi:hypothetical protein
MNIKQMKSSNFLKKEDVGAGALVTVRGVTQENVAMPGAEEELKWCLVVAEFEKPMVLNATNSQLIAAALGSEETDDWAGKKIVLYNDPNVSYAGKLIGGIRVRAPRNQPAPPPNVGFRSKSASQIPGGLLPTPEEIAGADDIPY